MIERERSRRERKKPREKEAAEKKIERLVAGYGKKKITVEYLLPHAKRGP